MEDKIVNKLIKNQDEIIKIAAQLIKYQSVKSNPEKNMPFGKECGLCLNHALEICQSFGMETKNIDGYIGYAQIGTGKEMIGILTHLDVVPVGNDWDYDPFNLKLIDGKIYGRGILDDKGSAAIFIHILKEILESNINLDKRIRLIFGIDEESGWECIHKYLETEELPTYGFTPDADFPIINGEKGILALKISSKTNQNNIVESLIGGNAINSVADSAQAILVDKSNLKTKGIAAHGSTPWLGENAIDDIVNEIVEYTKNNNVQLDNNIIKFYSEYLLNEYDGKSLNIDFEDEQSGKLTCNTGLINIDDKQSWLTLDIRYPISINYEEIINNLEPKLKEYELNYEILDHNKPIYIEEDHFLVQKLLNVYNEVTNSNEKPVIIGGGTYARAMDNIVAFGPLFPGTYDSGHQKNEFINYDDFLKSIEIYAKALIRLLQ